MRLWHPAHCAAHSEEGWAGVGFGTGEGTGDLLVSAPGLLPTPLTQHSHLGTPSNPPATGLERLSRLQSLSQP